MPEGTRIKIVKRKKSPPKFLMNLGCSENVPRGRFFRRSGSLFVHIAYNWFWWPYPRTLCANLEPFLLCQNLLGLHALTHVPSWHLGACNASLPATGLKSSYPLAPNAESAYPLLPVHNAALPVTGGFILSCQTQLGFPSNGVRY